MSINPSINEETSPTTFFFLTTTFWYSVCITADATPIHLSSSHSTTPPSKTTITCRFIVSEFTTTELHTTVYKVVNTSNELFPLDNLHCQALFPSRLNAPINQRLIFVWLPLEWPQLQHTAMMMGSLYQSRRLSLSAVLTVFYRKANKFFIRLPVSYVLLKGPLTIKCSCQ